MNIKLRGKLSTKTEYHVQQIWSKCSGFYRFYDLRLVQVLWTTSKPFVEERGDGLIA